MYLDRKLGWAGVITGERDVVEIQGGHGDMLDGPRLNAQQSNWQRTSALLRGRKVSARKNCRWRRVKCF